MKAFKSTCSGTDTQHNSKHSSTSHNCNTKNKQTNPKEPKFVKRTLDKMTYDFASIENKYSYLFDDHSTLDKDDIFKKVFKYFNKAETALRNKTKLKELKLFSSKIIKELNTKLTISLVSPKENIKSGVDDIELTFSLRLNDMDKVIHNLNKTSGVKNCMHHKRKGYNEYNNKFEFKFRKGGAFIIYYKKNNAGTQIEKCFLSFRPSEAPLSSINKFFFIIKESIGTGNYKSFLKSIKVIRKDLCIEIYDVPSNLILVDTKSKIKNISVFDNANSFHGTTYLGNDRNSHTAIYCMTRKLLDKVNKKYGDNIVNKIMESVSRVYCGTKIERRLKSNQQRSMSTSIKHLECINGHQFDNLQFYSPRVFNELSEAMIRKILIKGFAKRHETFTNKELSKLKPILGSHLLHFEHEDVCDELTSYLLAIKKVIISPKVKLK
ncbi:hypothetical protein A9267_17650 [Shewanella sp. UCD-FRSSP16_17]|uniref:hypothetical protein n=1 Tax=Shewanella sp. UCD-FRSSP16_17 TaxID=1853256 RepID=UPI0007EE9F27|nr:hypothetical protein [Shewanella sp. UCD-FRSSP16_17]OBT04765.1 hypothetical protein A9267_17650 [Shewanella sp. UCD-FRSSP16_17]